MPLWFLARGTEEVPKLQNTHITENWTKVSPPQMFFYSFSSPHTFWEVNAISEMLLPAAAAAVLN